MAIFESIKSFPVILHDLEPVAVGTMAYFKNQGFETAGTRTLTGGYDLSLRKGGMFKTVLGMKSALKVSIEPRANEILVSASIGIFDTLAVPTVISVLVFWPVLIAQIWGLVKQAGLDDEAINCIEKLLKTHGKIISNKEPDPTTAKAILNFCCSCGAKLSRDDVFCPVCRQKHY